MKINGKAGFRKAYHETGLTAEEELLFDLEDDKLWPLMAKEKTISFLQEHPDFADEIDKQIRANADRLSFARGGKTVAPKKEPVPSSVEQPADPPAPAAKGKSTAVNIDVEVDE